VLTTAQPGGLPKDLAHATGGVPDLLVLEAAIADVAQQVMNLIDGQHSRRRIVDGR